MAPQMLKKKLKKVQEVKLKKVQEMRTDTPAMLEALDALSTFYKPEENTLEARRNLRSDLEERGLRMVEEFIARFEPIQKKIDSLRENVDKIHSTCDTLTVKLDSTLKETAKFADAARSLSLRKAELLERAQVMDNFLKRFKLSDSQLTALREGPKDEDDGALFFSALEDVQRIREECQSLISSQFQSAGLEIFDAMASFQEQAYEQLFTWVQSQCANIDAEFPEPSDALQKGISTLAQHPAYYEHAQACIADTRSVSISKRFAIALTHGGSASSLRPIEMHAHDPLRYVGDMLAWIHQNMAVEKSLVQKLFPLDAAGMQGNNAETDVTSKDAKEKNAEILGKVFEGVISPLTNRVRQVFGSGMSLVVSFKMSNLLEFYQNTFRNLIGSAASLPVETLGTLHKESVDLFFNTVKFHCDKLLASPPAYPRDLSVALEVSELIRRLSEVLTVQSGALSSSDTSADDAKGEADAESRFLPVLDAFIEPLLQMCRQSASGLDRSDAAVYIINNLVAIQSSLTRYDFTVSWVQKLTGEIGDWTDLLVKEQADAILRRSGMSEKIELVQRADPSQPLSQQAGMDVDSLKHVLSSFYKSMFSLVMPEFDRLVNPRLRASARNATAQAVASAYEDFYKTLHDAKDSGYTPEQLQEILLHDPTQVRQLLDA